MPIAQRPRLTYIERVPVPISVHWWTLKSFVHIAVYLYMIPKIDCIRKWPTPILQVIHAEIVPAAVMPRLMIHRRNGQSAGLFRIYTP